MLVDYYAIKLGMTQVWDQSGRRLPATILKVQEMMVMDKKELKDGRKLIEVGIGQKKLKNAKKPLRTKLKKSGFSFAPLKIRGVYLISDEAEVKVGDLVPFDSVLSVGAVVDVQGISKGRGFAGGMKRHGFKGGPKTHGQSDRARAVGSIGAGTTPGRVLKGKRMPGHYGVETKTVKGLTILAYNPERKEILISGPVPGHIKSVIRLRNTGRSKEVRLLESSLETINFLTKLQPDQTDTAEKDVATQTEVKEATKKATKETK